MPPNVPMYENFAVANVSASQTDSVVVPSVTGKRIKVISFRVTVGATATNVTFNSKGAGAGTAVSEVFQCGANGGIALPYNACGHFQTNSGEGLSITTGAGSTAGIGVVYMLV